MSSEKAFDKFCTMKRRLVGVEQVHEECLISIENGDEPKKILSVSASSEIENLNSGSETTVNGKVTFNLIYLLEDNMVNSQVSVCPFTVRVNGETSGYTYADSKIIEKSVESISGNNVKILVTVEVCVYEIVSNEVLSLNETREDVCLKEKELEWTSFVKGNEQTFTEENTLTLKEKVKSILSYQSGVVVKSYSAGYNFITVQGDVLTRLVYVVDDNRDKICTTILSSPFKQELEIDGVNKSDKIEVMARVIASDVNAVVEENENNTTVTVKVPIFTRTLVYRCSMINAVCDLYSTKSKVTTKNQEYIESKFVGCDYFESKIEGNLTLSEDSLRVDKLLAVTGEGYVLSNAYIQNGELFVEGIAQGTLVYLNDETGDVSSVEIEFPFSVSERTKYENVDLSVNVTLTDIDAIVKRGREVFFDGKLKVEVCYYSEEKNEILSEVNFEEDYEENRYPIEVYFAKSGESLWNIAKNLKVKDSFLLSQNPMLTDPLEKDEKIVLYFQKNNKD